MKRKVSLLSMLVLLCALFFMAPKVEAATNPLAGMPKKVSYVMGNASTGTGCDYFTPEYKSKVKITAKSTNTKVVKVKGYSFENEGKYFAGYETTAVGPGKAKINITVKVGGKTYKKTLAYTCYAYKNPFKTLKIGSKSYQSKFKKIGSIKLSQKQLAGKLTWKLQSGFSMTEAQAYYQKKKADGTFDFGSKKLKSGNKLPANTYLVSMKIKNKKTGVSFTTAIYTN